MIRRLCIAVAVVLGTATVVVLGSATTASAATCQAFASYGIKVCGEWNGSVTDQSGIEFAKTSSFQWTVTRSDPTLRIVSVTVLMGGLSACSTGWSECRNFEVRQQVSRAPTGTTYNVPSWHGEWGQISGPSRYQQSNLSIRWCHGTDCVTDTTENIGPGSTDMPPPVEGH